MNRLYLQNKIDEFQSQKLVLSKLQKIVDLSVSLKMVMFQLYKTLFIPQPQVCSLIITDDYCIILEPCSCFVKTAEA